MTTFDSGHRLEDLEQQILVVQQDFALNHFLCLLAVVGVGVDRQHFETVKVLVSLRQIHFDAVERTGEIAILDLGTELEVVDVSRMSENRFENCEEFVNTLHFTCLISSRISINRTHLSLADEFARNRFKLGPQPPEVVLFILRQLVLVLIALFSIDVKTLSGEQTRTEQQSNSEQG